MFQDWESGEIVTRINVEAKNVGLQFLFLLFSLIQPFFDPPPLFCLGFLVWYWFVSSQLKR